MLEYMVNEVEKASWILVVALMTSVKGVYLGTDDPQVVYMRRGLIGSI